jgi:hypothetical protein
MRQGSTPSQGRDDGRRLGSREPGRGPARAGAIRCMEIEMAVCWRLQPDNPLPAAPYQSSIPESIGRVGRRIGERRLPRHHLGEQPACDGSKREAVMRGRRQTTSHGGARLVQSPEPYREGRGVAPTKAPTQAVPRAETIRGRAADRERAGSELAARRGRRTRRPSSGECPCSSARARSRRRRHAADGRAWHCPGLRNACDSRLTARGMS